MKRLQRTLLLALTDLLLLNTAVVLAFIIRFEGAPPRVFIQGYERVALLVTVLSLVSFVVSGYYSRLWRYAGAEDILVILKGTTLASLTFWVITLGWPQAASMMGQDVPAMVDAFPRTVIVLTWLLATALIGGLRLSLRYADLRFFGKRKVLPDGRQVRRTLVVGAGEAGALVVRQMRNGGLGVYDPVGFVDDDSRKVGLKIHGVPVLGDRSRLAEIIRKHEVDKVIIAMPTATGEVIQDVVNQVRGMSVRVRIFPGLESSISQGAAEFRLRDIQVEDLLGRKPVRLNMDEISEYLTGKVVMVTGAGGSIGSELCRQVASFAPERLVLVDHSENGLHEIVVDLEYLYPDLPLQIEVADIRDTIKMKAVMEQSRPGVVFHAAAHKHVPLMQMHPDEAVKTNVIGTYNVASLAIEFGVERFVLISTDKAVYPTTVLGYTKRLAEVVVQSLHSQFGDKTRFMIVRFGNVLGSRGSVVPLFQEQIRRGGPVTVTHAEMRRYFMTIPEAVQLVVQAGAMGSGGEVFVLDMGEPVRILELAENLVRLSGLEPYTDVPIVVTQPRAGEKLNEDLFLESEGLAATHNERIFVTRVPLEPHDLNLLVEGLVQRLECDPPENLTDHLQQLVSETDDPAFVKQGLVATGD